MFSNNQSYELRAVTLNAWGLPLGLARDKTRRMKNIAAVMRAASTTWSDCRKSGARGTCRRLWKGRAPPVCIFIIITCRALLAAVCCCYRVTN